jgi:hypothetical protein
MLSPMVGFAANALAEIDHAKCAPLEWPQRRRHRRFVRFWGKGRIIIEEPRIAYSPGA